MKRQLTFADLRWPKARPTRLKSILAMLDRAIAWAPLLDTIAPHYPRPGNGRQPVLLEIMVRIRVCAHVLGANDRQTEELLIDSAALCAFCRLDDSAPRPPDAETIANFRRRLARVGLDGVIEERVRSDLTRRAASVIPGEIREPRWLGPPM